jgi:hypothetical protein
MVFRLTAVNAAPDLKRQIAEWEFPTDRHPTANINAFRTKKRELETVLPLDNDGDHTHAAQTFNAMLSACD